MEVNFIVVGVPVVYSLTIRPLTHQEFKKTIANRPQKENPIIGFSLLPMTIIA
jgi:hypothetical protein